MKAKKFNRSVVTLFLIILFVSYAAAQNPKETWRQYKTPEEAGFSSQKLQLAKERYEKSGAAAFLVVYNGNVLVSWGDVERRFICHSMRKSFISAMYGIQVDRGVIDIDKTLEALKIDDQTPLTKEEKQATIRDLLKARSGVYIPAAAETEGMRARRPKRGSHKPGTFWYYNNWDFNVLGAIYRRETGTDIFEDFKARIGDPIQMEDFQAMDGFYYYQEEYSRYPAYHFKMSARDAARFGLLFLQRGKWNGKQVISEKWVKESTASYSDAGGGSNYGYLWWISKPFADVGMYSAYGVGTQIISVLPGAGMVIVQRVNTYKGDRAGVDNTMFRMILDARVSEPKPNPEFVPLQSVPSYTYPPVIKLSSGEMDRYVREYEMEDEKVAVEKIGGDLIMVLNNNNRYRLFPLSKSRFIMEDVALYAYFEFDKKGVPFRVTSHQSEEALEMYKNIIKRGAVPVLGEYKKKIESDTGAYRFDMRELNYLGYQLLGVKETDHALEVFKYNAGLNPGSFRVYVALGYTYLEKGDKKMAKANFEKSLELNPNNTRVKEELEKLSKDL